MKVKLDNIATLLTDLNRFDNSDIKLNKLIIQKLNHYYEYERSDFVTYQTVVSSKSDLTLLDQINIDNNKLRFESFERSIELVEGVFADLAEEGIFEQLYCALDVLTSRLYMKGVNIHIKLGISHVLNILEEFTPILESDQYTTFTDITEQTQINIINLN